MSRARLLVVTTTTLTFSACATFGTLQSRSHKEFLTPAERAAAIARARVWSPTRVAAMNLRAGPQGRDSFAPEQTVSCDYVDKKLSGNTPKFACKANGEELKVRYGRTNGEVYAGVAASRLLWALGFGADALYPVHVLCRGCPASLHGDGIQGHDAVRFDVAAIERKMPGHDMETREVAGWAWPELDRVDTQRGGAPAAQRDALKLLAVLIQHTDSKAEQQRLLCPDDEGHKKDLAACPRPLMMIHDVGQTFGTGNQFNRQAVGSVNLREWKNTPVWKDASRCVGNLTQSQTGTLVDPRISEDGRAFLARLLAQLTDGQLRDLFGVARFEMRPQPDGHPTTIDEWVDAFKEKRREIVSARCSEP
ncbi:MAG TPA: hypothetical protein VFB07_12970 [Vicinamibacterales bacterium]|nr:hypothetical protein [Vicinamibacterales bacterium]